MPKQTPARGAAFQSYRFQITRRQETTPSSMHTYHYHNYYEVYYLRSGERYYFIQDRSYRIGSGTLVMIPPYDTHSTAASEELPYERILIGFAWEYLSPLLPILGEATPFECFEKRIYTVHFSPTERAHVETLLEMMMVDAERTDQAREARLSLALAQLLLYAARCGRGGMASVEAAYMNETHKTVSDVTGYINKHYAEEMNLSELATRFYISPCYLSRIFRRFTGVTFIEYLNSVRIKEAKRLLHSTKLGIGEIGEAVGYRTNTHFGRIFKEITGVSPQAYAKQMRGTQK